MQTLSNTFPAAHSTRLAAALSSVLVSATLVGAVVLAFDHQVQAAPVALVAPVATGGFIDHSILNDPNPIST